jgi:hypothetical protein
VLGVPVKEPVPVSKDIPGGSEDIAKLVIAPPVECVVKPAADSTVRVSEESERVKAGANNEEVTVKVKTCVAEGLVPLVAVTV